MQFSLFWRTFLMIGALIVVSILLSLQLVRRFDPSPPDQSLAWEVTSVINLTRVALLNSVGDRRQMLLSEIARDEGVRVTPLEASDRVETIAQVLPSSTGFARDIEARLQHDLAPGTRVAGRVNGEDGFWVSFDIDGDPYWLTLKRERFERQIGPSGLLIGLMSLTMSAVGAILISRLLNQPLARLASALERVSRGEMPKPLPETVASEIAWVNRRFNRMASELAAIESDRAVALAGISHDIRTPLARLRMEIELSSLLEADKQSMSDEIERINDIVGQFLEFARAGAPDTQADALTQVDLAALLQSARDSYLSKWGEQDLRIELDVTVGTYWFGSALDVQRIITNLIENARRYGRNADDGIAQIRISATRAARVANSAVANTGKVATKLLGPGVVLTVSDRGPGVSSDQFERLLRPFARADGARGSHGGAGLGLAIVARLARRYDGNCALSRAPGGGLQVTVWLGDLTPTREPNRPGTNVDSQRQSQG